MQSKLNGTIAAVNYTDLNEEALDACKDVLLDTTLHYAPIKACRPSLISRLFVFQGFCWDPKDMK